MDIATASMGMSMNALQNQVSISVLKKSMDGEEQIAQNMIESLKSSAPPPLPAGRKLDMYI